MVRVSGAKPKKLVNQMTTQGLQSEKELAKEGKFSCLDVFNCIIASIGCITGMLSLSWQIWETLQGDKLLASVEYSRNYPSNVLSITIEVTNLGQKDIFVRDVALIHEEAGRKSYSGMKLVAEELSKEPLAPGGFRTFRLTRDFVEFDQLIRLHGNFNVFVRTSRGAKFYRNIDDELREQLAQYKEVTHALQQVQSTRPAIIAPTNK
jgi:hypothetical protein